MEEKINLHLVAFNIPYPPNYGGIIDIYYKVQALHKQGVNIILHAFLYGRQKSELLEAFASEVNYYKRKRGPAYLLSSLPYIVVTRQSSALKKRLLADQYPVLFEGLHSTFLLEKCASAGKKCIVRAHNIEHNYYSMLAKSERNIFKKLFFHAESLKLKNYERIMHSADKILAISSTDASYFKDKYEKSIHVPAFHQQNEINPKTGKGEYILFHGNLSVPENEKALLFLLKTVLGKINYPVIIAGKEPGWQVRKKCAAYPNINLIASPEGEEMDRLVSEAHINLLYTYQPTGLKLKLLHSLYSGRFCLANTLMLSGSGLDELCVLYRTPEEAIEKIDTLMLQTFPEQEIIKRKAALKEYNNSFNANKIIELL